MFFSPQPADVFLSYVNLKMKALGTITNILSVLKKINAVQIQDIVDTLAPSENQQH